MLCHSTQPTYTPHLLSIFLLQRTVTFDTICDELKALEVVETLKVRAVVNNYISQTGAEAVSALYTCPAPKKPAAAANVAPAGGAPSNPGTKAGRS